MWMLLLKLRSCVWVTAFVYSLTWLLFTRPGSSWTPDTAKARMKVGVALGESELYLLLKYQSIWPSLNARDLETFADELCRLLGCADNRLSN